MFFILITCLQDNVLVLLGENLIWSLMADAVKFVKLNFIMSFYINVFYWFLSTYMYLTL